MRRVIQMRKVCLVMALISIMVLMSGCKVWQPSITTTTMSGFSEEFYINKTQNQSGLNESDISGLLAIIEAYKQNINASAIPKEREYYGLPTQMFANLPDMPRDFRQVQILYLQNKWNYPIGRDYYNQPEWFPNFKLSGINNLKTVDPTRFGAYGYMVYPSDSVITLSKSTKTSGNRTFWMRPSWIIVMPQGIHLVTSYPSSALIESPFFVLADGSKGVNQIPSDASQYFEVTVSPELFLLKPNFPIFNPESTIAVNVTIKLRSDVVVPVGNYVIGIDTGAVPEEQEKAWIREYMTKYVSGSMIHISRPYYQAFVSVVE